MTVYQASTVFNIPWTTLKDNVSKYKSQRESNQDAQFVMPKIGKPFALPVELELRLLAFITEMQQIGFSLSLTQIKQVVFSLAKAAKVKNLRLSLNFERKYAGKKWWETYRKRYGLTFSLPENVPDSREDCPGVLDDFYEKLEETLSDYEFSPERIWNCDEVGLMFAEKNGTIITNIGNTSVYSKADAEGTTTKLLSCVNAAGSFLPPFIIFKGIRVIPELTRGLKPDTQVRFSPKGWITGDLFLDWIKFFVKNIPPVRPVLLIVDSYASHIVPQVLEYARTQQIILFPVPSHTSAARQPLDVGIYPQLTGAWSNEIEKYELINCVVPTIKDFHKYFTPAFEKTFTSFNIRTGFEKSGICPFNRNALKAQNPLPESSENEDEQTDSN